MALDGIGSIRLSFLYNTFGQETSCLKRYISDPRLKLLQVHLVNEVCQRNGRCGKYEFLHGMSVNEYRKKLQSSDPRTLNRLVEYSRPIAEFLNSNLRADTRLLVSVGLESNVSSAEAANAINALRPLFPRGEFVHNPAGINPRKGSVPNTYYEEHGSKVRLRVPCVANLDGEHLEFHGEQPLLSNVISVDDIPAYNRKFQHCEANFLWSGEFNGIAKGSFIDPRQRKNWPSRNLFKKYNGLLKELTAPPPQIPEWSDKDELSKKGCKSYETFDGGTVWKQSDTRPGAVFVMGFKFKKQFRKVVVLKEGKVFDQLDWSGFANGNRQHWRSQTPAIPAKKFPFNVVLKAENTCWIIRNPKERNA